MTDTLAFGRSGSIMRFWPALGTCLLLAVFGTSGLIVIATPMSPRTGWVVLIPVAFGLLWFGLAVFVVGRDVSRLTVSGRDMRLHRRIGASTSIDLSSLHRIVVFGADPTEYVLLPKYGPPLITLTSSDWPKEVPVEVGEYMGVEVDALGEVSTEELEGQYPNNARATATSTASDDLWPGRTWHW